MVWRGHTRCSHSAGGTVFPPSEIVACPSFQSTRGCQSTDNDGIEDSLRSRCRGNKFEVSPVPPLPLVSKHHRRKPVQSTFYRWTGHLLFHCYDLPPRMLGELLRLWYTSSRTSNQAVMDRATARIDVAGVCDAMQCNLAVQTFYTWTTQHGTAKTEPRNM